MKIDEADVEEGGADVVDIPFHRTRPIASAAVTGNKPGKLSIDRFDPSNSKKMQPPEPANSLPKILQAHAQHPARTR
jgi:hypothetical protein